MPTRKPQQKRNFFLITEHLDPRPLYSFVFIIGLNWPGWIMNENKLKSGVNRYSTKYWDARNEGMATAVEEIFMQAGFDDDDPLGKGNRIYHARSARCAGVGSLYAHANESWMKKQGGVPTSIHTWVDENRKRTQDI